VGRISVEFEGANYWDLIRAQDGSLAADQVRRETIQGVVGSGATKLVLPQALVKRLGLLLDGSILVQKADGRKVQRARTEGVHVKLLGRSGTYTAIVEPRLTTALVG
jgi:hypothetical protein